MSAKPLIIHTTPPLEPLPACDIRSLYLIAVLQLQCPGRWSLRTGGWAANGGKLPYLTHLEHFLPNSHLHSLPAVPHPDSDLSKAERAEALCWVSYIEGQITDLVHHTLYSLPPNYPTTVGKAHLSNLKFPQSQYIPQRLRAIHKARLQHIGLWGLGGMNEGDLADEDRKRLEEVYVQAPGGTKAPRAWSGWNSGKEFEEKRRKLGEEEVVKRARGAFEVLDRRLGDKPYFFGNKPTTPDLELFAHLALILTPHLPNPLLPNTLQTHFLNLLAHHDRILYLLFPSLTTWSSIPLATPLPSSSQTWLEYLSPASWFPGSRGSVAEKKELSKRDRDYKRGRWLWFAGAGVAMITYVLASGLVSIEFGSEIDEEEREDEMEEIVVLEDDEDEEDEV